MSRGGDETQAPKAARATSPSYGDFAAHRSHSNSDAVSLCVWYERADTLLLLVTSDLRNTMCCVMIACAMGMGIHFCFCDCSLMCRDLAIVQTKMQAWMLVQSLLRQSQRSSTET